MENIQEEIHSGQYLTFTLREEQYAIEIHKVREVLDVTTLTKIPRMPEYLSGVINLRGSVVPIIDLGFRLGMEKIRQTQHTCVMIMQLNVGENTIEIGVLTDAVQMVLDLKAEEIEPVPQMSANIDTTFIKGMGRQDNDKFLIVIDLDTILTGAEIEEIGHVGVELETATA